MTPRLHIEQKITAFTNLYKVFGSGPEGAKTSLISFAQQKRITFKEKITFYADEQKSRVTHTLRAEKVFDVHGKYFVEDEDGNMLGQFQKQFKKSLLTSTWNILDEKGEVAYIVKESNLFLALIRRFARLIPFVGDLIEIIVLLFRYHFVFTDVKTGEVVGKYSKTTLFRDHYTLELTDDAWESLNWQTYSAFSVALDALQSR